MVESNESRQAGDLAQREDRRQNDGRGKFKRSIDDALDVILTMRDDTRFPFRKQMYPFT
jgi:hypothetical protein